MSSSPRMSLTRSRFCARLLHLALGLLLVRLELGDAGGLLDQVAALFGLGGDDQADAPLLDDRVGLGAHAGAEEQRRHVHQAHGHLVDHVRAVAVARKLARDRDLGVVAVLLRHVARVVVEGERHFGEAVRTARLGAVEDDVVHVLAAQVLGRLLTHGPAHRVDDVRLAAAVRADDARHVVIKAHDRAIHERLEAAHFEHLELHPDPLGRSRKRSSPANTPSARSQSITRPPVGLTQ